ncbi:hypothetical protein ZHAS_00009890 [Anopheles sinensis]|uniref:C2H2-type domain-containing protein n=1 Tax=Anopheles sinensis TaxID=74873 RepID=A0A084VW70_ANOSI|nr:hypothetical protein ZHAS_00009890 [Anopheles sinensis]
MTLRFRFLVYRSETLLNYFQDLQHFTPSGVCQSCFEELNTFLAYRKRLNLVLRFVSSLAHIAKGETNVLEELVRDHHSDLRSLLQQLKILQKDELVVQDLLAEFHQYRIGWLKEESGKQNEADHLDNPRTVVLETIERRAGLPEENMPSVDKLDSTSENEEEPVDEINVKLDDLSEAEQFAKQSDHSYGMLLNVSFVDYCSDEETIEQPQEAVNQSDGTDVIEASRETLSEYGEVRQAGDDKKGYQQCKSCKFRTRCGTTFQLHLEKHLNEESEPWLCKRCNLTFDGKRELNQHKRSTHRDYMCDTCGMAFDCKFSLRMHRKRHEEVRQYKCEYCPVAYFTMPEMTLHVRQAHLKAFEVKCSVCALPFRTKQSLDQHMKTHTSVRTHTCTICGFSFKSHTHLSRHMKGVHQGVQYTCEHCNTSYRRKDKLRLHMERTHNSYNAAEKLEKHKTHHSNPKELQCGTCLGAYLTQKEFDEHLCITYRENYICCNRDFKYQSFYNKHMLLVHGEHTNVRVKPTDGLLIGQFRAMRRQEIRCPNCGQEFPTRTQKNNHVKTCSTAVYEEQYIDEQPDVNQCRSGGTV